MKTALLILLVFTGLNSFSQSVKEVSFVPVIGDEEIALGKSYSIDGSKDSVEVKVLKFYISQGDSTFLLDASTPKSLKIPLKFKEELQFNLGVDSLKNASGALAGDLDPMKGMYWTWQSGYINVKLEGVYRGGKEFTFHLGGYQNGFLGMQKVALGLENKNQEFIVIDLGPFFSTIGNHQSNKIMSPSKKAVDVAATLSRCFKWKE